MLQNEFAGQVAEITSLRLAYSVALICVHGAKQRSTAKSPFMPKRQTVSFVCAMIISLNSSAADDRYFVFCFQPHRLLYLNSYLVNV